ncbi:MAG: T9SS type A sorting domain-containing protein [bacterium]|nr:T9SS type A sorting domain-containing protein [bacterium]
MPRKHFPITAPTVTSRLKAQVLAAIVSLMPASAWAVPIPVSNPSFEDLPALGLPNTCGGGCSYAQDFIPGWVNIPFLGLGLVSGQFQPGAGAGNSTYFDSLSDGLTSAYTSTGCVEQTVGIAVQPGVTYTLLVDVGWRKDADPAGMPRLRVNDVYYDGVGTPVYGGWATYTTTYVGQAQDAGLPITICLTSVAFQGNFDNVRLSASDASSGVDPATASPVLRLQAQPNPFGATTLVQFSLARRSPVVLRVFDVSGRVVRTLLDAATLEAGAHEAAWNGVDDAGQRTSSGLYFLQIETSDGGRVERVLFVR